MPLYEYYCNQCSREFELLIRQGDKPVCPHCGSKKLKKWMSVPSAHTQNGQPSCEGASMGCTPESMPCCGSRGCEFR